LANPKSFARYYSGYISAAGSAIQVRLVMLRIINLLM
jgi:hypothetical protein